MLDTYDGLKELSNYMFLFCGIILLYLIFNGDTKWNKQTKIQTQTLPHLTKPYETLQNLSKITLFVIVPS